MRGLTLAPSTSTFLTAKLAVAPGSLSPVTTLSVSRVSASPSYSSVPSNLFTRQTGQTPAVRESSTQRDGTHDGGTAHSGGRWGTGGGYRAHGRGATTRAGQEIADDTVKEEAGAEAVEAVESYRAARSAPWGADLPKPFLRDLLHCLKGQRGWRGSRFRLVCAGWQVAHDEQCTRLQLKLWNPMRAALPCLERVTEVDVASVSEAVRSKPKGNRHQYDDEVAVAATLHLHLAKLRSLPSLTNLALDIPVAASTAVAIELGSLTTLTTVRVRRNLDLHWDRWEEDRAGGRA